jgi:hypothetical protein
MVLSRNPDADAILATTSGVKKRKTADTRFVVICDTFPANPWSTTLAATGQLPHKLRQNIGDSPDSGWQKS